MFDAFLTRVRYQLVANKRKNLIRGVVFVVAGMLIATISAHVAFPFEKITGAALILIGGAHFVWAIQTGPSQKALFYSAFFIMSGLAILWMPQPALVIVVTLLAILMSMEGVLEVILAFRYHPVDYWGWMLLVGFVTLVIATIVWMLIPTVNVAALSWVVATSVGLYGLLLLMLSWQTKY